MLESGAHVSWTGKPGEWYVECDDRPETGAVGSLAHGILIAAGVPVPMNAECKPITEQRLKMSKRQANRIARIIDDILDEVIDQAQGCGDNWERRSGLRDALVEALTTDT